MKNKIKKINYNHSFIFFIFCNFFSLVIFKTINSIISPLICLFLILSIGVSHGSLDHLKGKKLFKIYSIANISYFYLIYIFIATTIILLWMMFPTFSLIVFLIVASFHFGKEDSEFIDKRSNFDLIGSAHNIKELNLKKLQRCSYILFSKLFQVSYKPNDKFFGLLRFNLLMKNLYVKC